MSSSSITPSPELPIESRLVEIHEAMAQHNRVLLVAEPGAGKTTRVPASLLTASWCQAGRLLLLEPRRVAARLAARYMAEQLGESVGQRVGYRVRGESCVSPQTRLEVVTQGILTRTLQDDPMLEGVSGIIFDEFHERSLDADLGLALTLDMQSGLREDLRLLVMSATLDVAALRGVLGSNAPLIDVPGRTYPVETRHLPVARNRDGQADLSAAVRQAIGETQGDVLMFLPGVGEIRRLARVLAGLSQQSSTEGLVIHELHGRMSLEAQQHALDPDPQGRRRLVLSTAIAESSITVDGIRVVIDAGYERLSRFQPRTGMTRLVTQRVSRASADQRRGRAGRQAPGVCYRLWSEEQVLPAHGDPEILQADLSGLAFELARWGVTRPEALAWVTPPPAAGLHASRELLRRLGILDAQHTLTPLGRACTRWPTHPRLASLLEHAVRWNVEALGCWLAAYLERRVKTDGVDIAEALSCLPDSGARGEAGQWHREAQRLASIAGCRLGRPGLEKLGELLAVTYPERVAKRLEPGRFKMAGGGLASLDDRQRLAHAPLIVAVDLDGDARQARIYQAVSVSQSAVASLFPETRRWQARLNWSEEAGRLIGEEVRALGELVLERRPLAQLPQEAILDALLQAVRRTGRLPLDDQATQLQQRVMLLRRELGDEWPDWSTPALLATLETWLAPYLSGVTQLDAIGRMPLASYLLDSLDWPQRQRLDALAPTHLEVPSGSRIGLDYCGEEDVVLAVKLQEVFGWQATPCLLEGRVAVTLHLLSPARRPLQVTRDLASFWSNGYPEVRKEMRGRYPKHPWPDDPFTAQPTSRTKRASPR
ncbi:ATP-dependent helicase HrpB [Litchfieldella xinjiangensis]|uniref:ATP-dependent helicase HrpB n=1 Tax=Litchfieldella xinjiangensis TaxID=1166948 RepID=UPI0005BB8EF9|nr:ATP-dependent helicase HrpB [Halomonas xinjiangensis]